MNPWVFVKGITNNSILLTFDVEDWFQVENFKQYISFSTWNSFNLRVEKNTHLLLDLMDSYEFRPKATFFILGWIAQKSPGLVREIYNRGHEIASHGFDHQLCSNLASDILSKDLKNSKSLLEDIIGESIVGYRAPSFVISDHVLKIINDAGYKYDSSYNSFSAHGRYGTLDLTRTERLGSAFRIQDDFYEIPISNIRLMNKIFPLGGGGYFRLLPFQFFRQGVKQVLNNDNTFVFYSHPWEFDPDQPKVNEASKWFKFRHYTNLNKTENKLRLLINTFSDCRFITCSQYLDSLITTRPCV